MSPIPAWPAFRRYAFELAFLTSLACAYLLLAVVHTYPLLWHARSHIPGEGLGDNVSFVWNLWWMREALASPDYEFFRSPFLFAPFGGSLILHTHTALSAFAGATVLAPLTVVEAQNVILIASLALNGLAAYLLAYVVTAARGPAMAAGALFLVTPAITTRLMGHFNLVLAWPLVLACVAFIRWSRAASWRTGLALAVTGALILYTDYYYGVFFGLFAAAYAATELSTMRIDVARRERDRASTWLFALAGVALVIAVVIVMSARADVTIGGVKLSLRTPTNALTAGWLLMAAAALRRWRMTIAWRWRRPLAVRRVLTQAVFPAAIFLFLVAPLTVYGWRMWRAGEYVTQASSLRSSPRGVDVATLVLGPPFNGAVGPAVRAGYRRLGIDPMESSAWIGLGISALLVVAFRSLKRDVETRRWTTIGGVFLVWALGPYLQVFGVNAGLLLPQAAARFLPIIDNARIPGRAMVLVMLCGVVLASLTLVRAGNVRRVALWAIVILGVVESLGTPLPLAVLPSVAAYGHVSGDATETVLPLPFGIRDGLRQRGSLQHDALYAQAVHPHALAGGFLARVPPSIWSWYETTEPYKTALQLSEGVEGGPLPTCEDVSAGLRSGSVSHVILNQDLTSRSLVEFVRSRMPLRRVYEDAHHIVFDVIPDACGALAP